MSPARNYRQKSTGKTVKGVTTILGSVLSKPALLWWAYKQGMSNFDRLMENIATISSNCIFDGLGKLGELQNLIQGFKITGLYDKRDKAANAGTLAHSFVENHLKGLPEPSHEGLPQDVIKKAEGCYLTFLDWERNFPFKVLSSEVELTSEIHSYGGTIDHVIETSLNPKGMVDLLDIKTGKDIYLEAKIQISAYGSLWNEYHPELPVAGSHILRLGENGEFTHKYFPNLDNRYFNIFLNCLNIIETLSELGEKL